MTAPTPHTFPYQGKWTKEQLSEVYERWERIKEALIDPVGPTGLPLGIPFDQVAILSFHLALAGGDVHEDVALIASRIRPAEHGMYADAREWMPKDELEPVPEDAEAKAAELAKSVESQQITPEVRQALARIFAAGDVAAAIGEGEQ